MEGSLRSHLTSMLIISVNLWFGTKILWDAKWLKSAQELLWVGELMSTMIPQTRSAPGGCALSAHFSTADLEDDCPKYKTSLKEISRSPEQSWSGCFWRESRCSYWRKDVHQRHLTDLSMRRKTLWDTGRAFRRSEIILSSVTIDIIGIAIMFVKFRPRFGHLHCMFPKESQVIWHEMKFEFYLLHSSWAKVHLTMKTIPKLLLWNLQNGTKTTFFYCALSQ